MAYEIPRPGRGTWVGMLVMTAVVAPAPAYAQESLRPDPDSPAGVEYALPLDQAREDSTGSEPKSRTRAASTPSPLFGAGIKGSATGGGAAHDAGKDMKRGGSSRERTPESARDSIAVATAATTDEETSSTLAIVLAVLVAGALGGLALRWLLGRGPEAS